MSLTSPIEWDDLASGNEIEIALDTEFQDVETLSIQFAARLHGQIRVQIYHAGTIPPPPQNTFGPKFARRFKGEKVTVSLDELLPHRWHASQSTSLVPKVEATESHPPEVDSVDEK